MSAAAAAALNNNDRTTFVATPVVESVDSGGQKVLHFLGIDCALCRRCLQSVPRNHEDAVLTNVDELGEAPRTPCSSHAEWTKTFEVQRKSMKSANIPKNDDDYKKSVFTPTDESSARLYAEMDALETDSVINENLVSGAVKNALKH